jgi:hypothetical protein
MMHGQKTIKKKSYPHRNSNPKPASPWHVAAYLEGADCTTRQIFVELGANFVQAAATIPPSTSTLLPSNGGSLNNTLRKASANDIARQCVPLV